MQVGGVSYLGRGSSRGRSLSVMTRAALRDEASPLAPFLCQMQEAQMRKGLDWGEDKAG
jgi:hypothetical protein